MGEVLIAPDYKRGISRYPVIFLAGPIQGAEFWQDAAIKYIQSKTSEVNIASPRRYTKVDGTFTEEMYNEQTDWELDHLDLANNIGAILFWFARESHHRCDRPFAQTTSKEFGMRYMDTIAVGFDEGSRGTKYVRRILEKYRPDVSIKSTLEDTCDEAIRLALSREY